MVTKKIYLGGSLVTVLGILIYLSTLQGVTITTSPDISCSGTINQPCVSYFNITSNYYTLKFFNTSNQKLTFSPDVKDYKIYRYVSKKWTEIKFPINMTKGVVYQFKIVGYKYKSSDTVKWGIKAGDNEIDPYWYGTSSLMVEMPHQIIYSTEDTSTDSNLPNSFWNNNYTLISGGYTSVISSGTITTNNNSQSSWNESFTGNQNNTFYVRVKKTSNVTGGTMDLSGYNYTSTFNGANLNFVEVEYNNKSSTSQCLYLRELGTVYLGLFKGTGLGLAYSGSANDKRVNVGLVWNYTIGFNNIINFNHGISACWRSTVEPTDIQSTLKIYNYDTGLWVTINDTHITSGTETKQTCQNYWQNFTINSSYSKDNNIKLMYNFTSNDANTGNYYTCDICSVPGGTCNELCISQLYMNLTYYPSNPYLDVGNDGTQNWIYTGIFNVTNNKTSDFALDINTYLSSCTPDLQGYCYVPFALHSDWGGKIQISSMQINYTSTSANWTINPSRYGWYKFPINNLNYFDTATLNLYQQPIVNNSYGYDCNSSYPCITNLYYSSNQTWNNISWNTNPSYYSYKIIEKNFTSNNIWVNWTITNQLKSVLANITYMIRIPMINIGLKVMNFSKSNQANKPYILTEVTKYVINESSCVSNPQSLCYQNGTFTPKGQTNSQWIFNITANITGTLYANWNQTLPSCMNHFLSTNSTLETSIDYNISKNDTNDYTITTNNIINSISYSGGDTSGISTVSQESEATFIWFNGTYNGSVTSIIARWFVGCANENRNGTVWICKAYAYDNKTCKGTDTKIGVTSINFTGSSGNMSYTLLTTNYSISSNETYRIKFGGGIGSGDYPVFYENDNTGNCPYGNNTWYSVTGISSDGSGEGNTPVDSRRKCFNDSWSLGVGYYANMSIGTLTANTPKQYWGFFTLNNCTAGQTINASLNFTVS